jgi:metallo-beta-lactamase class B
MKKILLCTTLAVILLLPIALFAGSKHDSGRDVFNGRDMFSCKPVKSVAETPITRPLETTRPADWPPWPTLLPGTDLTPMGPYKLFDNLSYIGTNNVGVYVVRTSTGLILIDAGWGFGDCAPMMNDLRKLGLDPADVKLILLSHEHIDHYGCVKEWKETELPYAKVAMTRLGWNYMRTRPVMGGFGGPRPESIDMYLTDGQRVHLGDTTIQIVATPGHSMGCVSFIIPVRDRGAKHVVGIMGGTAVQGNWDEAFVYYTSVEYLKQACTAAKCDVGLGTHAYRDYNADFQKIGGLKRGDPHPLVIGTEKFDTVYLQKYRKMALDKMKGLAPEGPPPPTP